MGRGFVSMFDEEDSILISKEVLPSLEGFDFFETLLGDPNGSLRQFRNSTGIHIREYSDYFEVHKDRVDPRKNPLGHLLIDSPETLAAFGAATILSRGFNQKVNLLDEAKSSQFDSPLGFFSMFLSLNRLFRLLKKLFF
jgi:hypothetical protein